MTPQQEIEAMIARMALGDRQAFVQLYQQCSAKLFGVLLRVLNDRAEAEEALQEVFVKIWRNAGRYQVNGLSPMTWLITIARNHAVDRLRRRRAAPVAPLEEAGEIADAGPDPEQALLSADMRRQIDRCLGELPDARAGAVKGAYLEGMSYAELATRHEVPLNTMRSWLRRSLAKLKECLTR